MQSPPGGAQDLIIEILRTTTAALLIVYQWLKNHMPRRKV